MKTIIRTTAWVQPGGKVEITDSTLPAGRPVEVLVLLPDDGTPARHSVVDVLADAPGHLAFRSADEVDAYLREEREAWER